MPIKKLDTIDADTLLRLPHEPLSFVVEDLLPQGLHLLAGAPKIGKSWLALWLCLQVAQGEPVWNFITQPCEVLYLCLEDSFQRIQSRLFDLTESAPPTLHFAVMSEQLHSGLLDQIEQFLKERPNTGLVVIEPPGTAMLDFTGSFSALECPDQRIDPGIIGRIQAVQHRFRQAAFMLKGIHQRDYSAEVAGLADLFTVTYDPAMIEDAIDDMIAHLNGEEVPKDHVIAVQVVDATNVNDFVGFGDAVAAE